MEHRKSTRAFCLLVMWTLWKHRNDIVFEGHTPSLSGVLQKIQGEGAIWAKAGLINGEVLGQEPARVERIGNE